VKKTFSKNFGSFEKNNEVLNNPETRSNIILEEPKTLEVTDNLEQVSNLVKIDDSIEIFIFQ